VIEGGQASGHSSARPLLQVVDAVKHFAMGHHEYIRAVDGVSFEVRAGETLGLVGECGCGKSTLAKIVSQLMPVTAGHVIFDGVDLTTLRGESFDRSGVMSK
jgi:ABC-type oligopeptide transport system ATPase subunit